MGTPRKGGAIGLLAVVALGGVAAACGNDSGESALSKPDYLRKANAICVELNRERERVAAKHFPSTEEPPTVEQLQAFAEEFSATNRDKIGELRALSAPEGDETEVDAIYDAADRVSEGLTRVATDEDLALETLEGDVPGAEQADRLAAEYGLTKCADGSTE